MFSKILIANRGEIAVRIIRACKEMGISTVAIYSLADKDALHVALAEEAVCVGPASGTDSYLNQSNIISAAILTGAQAIHPGYGFLAENSEFAAMCGKYGIVFIGPDADVIKKMGDKDRARRMMEKIGLKTIPGSEVLKNYAEARKKSEEIGFPLLLKARAGGGGKGIRLVTKASDLERSFLTASKEAEATFGDGGLYLEKYLTHVKHIEVQILSDEKGNVVCLGERECSIQKNNQKLIEECPSPAVSEELRKELFKAAAKAAKAVKYVNAGTVEFLLDRDGNFYFMEMNTRLQVEHAITEFVSGIDIVKWQIRIAAGVLLDFKQDDIKIQGASIECRVNATAGGKVSFLHIPGGPWVRFDTALYHGDVIPPYYDSLIGKIIVYGKNREEAIRKMQSALCELVVDGVPNNIEAQTEIINDNNFIKGDYYTDFLTKRGE